MKKLYISLFAVLFVLSAIAQPTCGISISAASCGQSDGTITIVVLSGIPPVSYKLDNGPYQFSGIFTGIAGGAHQAVATDITGSTTINFNMPQNGTFAAAGPDQFS